MRVYTPHIAFSSRGATPHAVELYIPQGVQLPKIWCSSIDEAIELAKVGIAAMAAARGISRPACTPKQAHARCLVLAHKIINSCATAQDYTDYEYYDAVRQGEGDDKCT